MTTDFCHVPVTSSDALFFTFSLQVQTAWSITNLFTLLIFIWDLRTCYSWKADLFEISLYYTTLHKCHTIVLCLKKARVGFEPANSDFPSRQETALALNPLPLHNECIVRRCCRHDNWLLSRFCDVFRRVIFHFLSSGADGMIHY